MLPQLTFPPLYFVSFTHDDCPPAGPGSLWWSTGCLFLSRSSPGNMAGTARGAALKPSIMKNSNFCNWGNIQIHRGPHRHPRRHKPVWRAYNIWRKQKQHKRNDGISHRGIRNALGFRRPVSNSLLQCGFTISLYSYLLNQPQVSNC